MNRPTGIAFLQHRIAEDSAAIAKLLDDLAQKDALIAQKDQRIAQLEADARADELNHDL